MLTRSIAAFTLLLAAGQSAPASERPLQRLSCALVRFYVAKYTLPAAEAWARNKGASEAEIETARKCLPASSVQTASFAQPK
jgi:hypothetical protein